MGIAKTDFQLTAPEPTLAAYSSGFTHSVDIGKISAALSKAQGSYEIATKDTKNPFFKSNYADLATVIGATRKALSDNGIAVIQSPQGDANSRQVVITTLLVHLSGEWFRGELALPCPSTKWDAQTVGSAITYARRYALQSLLAIAGEDDDGNLATEAARASERDEHHEKLVPKMDGQARIATYQVTAFVAACQKSGKTEAQVSAYLDSVNKYAKIEELQKQDWNEAIKWASKVQSPETSEGTIKAINESISQVRFKKLFALAGKKSIPESDIKRQAYEAFSIKSLSEMTDAQFEQLTAWVEEQQ